ncbi:MAG: hypothetical protein WD275_06170, partial [Rhodothermales bacterium]
SSTNLTTGERLEWRHREVTYEDGDVGHVFWSTFRAPHGHQYRLDVTRSDGAVSTATVTVPAGVEVELDTRSEAARLPVTIKGDAPNILGVGMRYEATNVPPELVWPEDRRLHPIVVHPVEVSYQGEGSRTAEGWTFFLNLQKDVEAIRSEYERNCLVTEGNPHIALRRVEFHFVAADEGWRPPGGSFDPEVLVDPGAMSNVDNGYGFFGAGEVVRIRWTPAKSLRDLLGFRTEAGCRDTSSPGDPACTDPPIPCIGENPESIWEIFF